MTVYKHILLGIDLHPECDTSAAKKAVDLAKLYNAKLSIVHAVEHINSYGIGQAYPGIMDVEEEILKSATQELKTVADAMGIPSSQQFVELGSPKSVLLHKADELKADLIILGSHGRHGFSLLLGSTANAILHNARCDVLAVRIPDDEK